MRLYAPSIALFAWALVWTLGVRGDAVVICGLVATGLAVVLHVQAALERYHGTIEVVPRAKRVRRFLRENWYRDLWLLAITGIVVWALVGLQDVQDTLVENQCKDLKVRIGQSQQFLDTRSVQEPGLADYVRKVTLPDLHKRLQELPGDTDC